jgi:tetratricopeptide (TPR) repeat protein
VGAYSLAQTARFFKISPARLRYWDRAALVRPGIAGGPHAFGFTDLKAIQTVVGLLARGVPLQTIRRSVELVRCRLPDVEQPARSLRLWLEGSKRVVVRHGEALFEPDGQLVIDFAGQDPGAVERLSAPTPSPVEWFELGCRLDTRPESWADAADAYRRAIEAAPGFADAFCNLGTVYYNQGRKAAARDCYERTLALAPGHAEASFNLANLLEEEGRDEAALRHYKRALHADPLFADARLNLALLYEKLGLPRTARAVWRRYLQLVPEGHWSDVARERLRDADH